MRGAAVWPACALYYALKAGLQKVPGSPAETEHVGGYEAASAHADHESGVVA